MAPLMAGRSPQTWAAVSAWCPISDLARWHGETTRRKLRYGQMLEKSCGGPPGASAEVDHQYAHRSPLTHLSAAAGVPIQISTGIEDGHKGSVPVGHTLRAYNAVAAEQDRIADAEIAARSEARGAGRPAVASRRPIVRRAEPALYRRTSGNARVTLFQGGHTILPESGLAWLEQQRKGRPAAWEVNKPTTGVTKGASEVQK